MGLRDRLRGLFRSNDPKGYPEPTNDYWYSLLNGFGGQGVTADSVQRVAAVYACQTAICESVAMLPALVFSEADERNKTKLKDHPVYRLLRDEPNQNMDSFEFFEALQQSLLDDGNAYAYILRAKSGKILSLTPLPYAKVSVKVLPNNTLGYSYTDPNGQKREYSADNVLHVKYKTKDGLVGRSPVRVVADSFSYSQSLLDHGNQLFDNGAFLSGFITAPFAFKTEESREKFMDSFKKYMGAKNSGKFALLEQGVDYKPFSMNNRDAQFIESKQLSVLDIARIYRVPPVMIQVTESGMSYASIEQLAIIWVQNTIQPWVTRYERAFKRQLFGLDEPDTYVRFNVSALIRGDLKSRTESLIQQLQYGLKTINEARSMLDDNAVDEENADKVLVSHNLIPLDKLGEVQQPNKLPDLPQDQPHNEPQQTKSARKEEFRPLFRELLGRLIRRESKELAAASKKPAFYKWAETYYLQHRALVIETIQPAIIAYQTDSENVAERFADYYLSVRTAQLLADTRPENDAETWADSLFDYLEGDHANTET